MEHLQAHVSEQVGSRYDVYNLKGGSDGFPGRLQPERKQRQLGGACGDPDLDAPYISICVTPTFMVSLHLRAGTTSLRG